MAGNETKSATSESRDSGARHSVGLLDLATRLPGVVMDAPVILRGALTGLLALPTTKTSIGKVFQDRAARYGDRVFIRFGDENIAKYLRQLPGGLVEISSHSPDPQHAPFTVRAEEFGNGIEIAGRLVR